MKKKRKYSVLLLSICSALLYGQESISVANKGILSVASDEIVSFQGTFENREEGDVTNDGTVFYFRDFINEGAYGITTNKTTSTAVFTVGERNKRKKQIAGNGVSSFYNIVFDSPVSQVAFDLKNNIDASGVVEFKDGIVQVDSTFNPTTLLSKGMFTFNKDATALYANDASHVDGFVEKVGKESFTYPLGHDGKYRPARISGSKNKRDIYLSRYVYNDQAFFEGRSHAVGVINKINTSEYWIINNAASNKSDVLVTLSWDDETTSPNVLTNPEEELHIIRWDEEAQLWVDEGGVVDMSTKEVTTIGTVKGYGIFTFGTVKKDWILDGDIVIYNLVTPDGDGKNDYFIIDHIKNYPNNKVEIYNRWGVRVYETTGYDPEGDGSSNVFKGYSEGKRVANQGNKLANGTYYYVITYEYTDANGSRTIKKAANLHLESN